MTTIIIFGVVMIIFGLVKNASNRQRDRMGPSPRAQRLLQKMQAQQQAASQAPQGQPTGRAQASAQLAGMLQQFLQTGQQQQGQNQYAPPGQYQPNAYQPNQYQPEQYQPQVHAQYQRPPAQNHIPTQNGEIEKRVRELMKTGQEVAAIRLLCDEQDMGIIEAQEYARGLVAPAGKPPRADQAESAPHSEPAEEETRYVGSAAFAESVFDLDREENVWAIGWVDKPEPEDRSDMDELWQTVRDNGRPRS